MKALLIIIIFIILSGMGLIIGAIMGSVIVPIKLLGLGQKSKQEDRIKDDVDII